MLFDSTLSRSVALIALASVVGCTEADLEETAFEQSGGSDLSSQSQEIILGEADWAPISEFQDDPVYWVGTRYGRAAAKLPQVGCSGFLIDDEVIVTAEHCNQNGSTSNASFGRIGETAGETAGAIADARQRLIDIGVPSSTANSLSQWVFTNWNCARRYDQTDDADVDYWWCDPNRVTWTESSGGIYAQTIQLDLYPGHVWGHMNIRVGERPEDREMYVLSVNDRAPDSAENVLLSPNGWVSDEEGTCFDWDPWNPNNNDHCFHYGGSDTRCGSSGGALIDATDHTVFGVVEGHFTWANLAGERGCSYDTYYDSSWWPNGNIGSYINNQSDQYVEGGTSAYSLGRDSSQYTRWLGGWGGNYRSLECPSNMLAAGVIGTTNDATDAVGSFGLVCVPHNTPLRYQLDRSRVILAGGRDTNFTMAYGDLDSGDLNRFMNETASTEMRDDSGFLPPEMVMCPPGYFITDLYATYDRSVHRVYRINCEDPQTGNRTMRSVSNGRIGGSRSGRYERYGGASCSDGTYFNGLQIRSGYWVDGFRPTCRYED